MPFDHAWLEKVAITPEKDRAIAEGLDAKARAFAEERGFIPKVNSSTPLSHAEIANLRMSKFDPGVAREGAPHAAAPPASPLAEREIMQANRVTTPLRELRHRTIGKATRFWEGQGGLGGKWRNRAAAIAALGTAGLGIKAYLDSQKARQPQLSSEEYPGLEPKLSSSNRYVQDGATIPAPPTQPKLVAPGPSVKGIPTLGVGSNLKNPLSVGSTGSSKPSQPTTKKADDGSLYSLLAGLGGGAAGGVGGWYAGEKLLKPMLEHKEKSLADAILKQEETLARLKNIKTLAPFGTAAIGAIILAALAASKARKDERENVDFSHSYGPYSNMGFDAGEQVYPGNPNPGEVY